MGDRCSVPLTEKRGGAAAGSIKDGGCRRDGQEEMVRLKDDGRFRFTWLEAHRKPAKATGRPGRQLSKWSLQSVRNDKQLATITMEDDDFQQLEERK